MFLISGKEIFGMLFKPLKCVPGEKYPTLLYVYGGPGVHVSFYLSVLFYKRNSYKILKFEIEIILGLYILPSIFPARQ